MNEYEVTRTLIFSNNEQCLVPTDDFNFMVDMVKSGYTPQAAVNTWRILFIDNKAQRYYVEKIKDDLIKRLAQEVEI